MGTPWVQKWAQGGLSSKVNIREDKMKITIGYGFKFDDESLKRVSKIYLGGGTAFETRKEAISRIETLKALKEIPKKEMVRLVKFTIEDTK